MKNLVISLFVFSYGYLVIGFKPQISQITLIKKYINFL